MKKAKRGVFVLICLMLFLTSCSSVEQGNTDNSAYEYQRELSQSQNELISTVAFVENTMIYQIIRDGETSYYSLDIPNDELDELGTVSNFIMDTGAVATFNGAVYFYVTVEDKGTRKNVLYSTNNDGSGIVELSKDPNCSPMLSLYSVPQGILALKVNDSKSWFELVVSEYGVCNNIVLESTPDEAFLIADVAGDYLYVLTYKTSNRNGETNKYYIRKYLLEDFSEAGIVSLQPISSYISDSRIGTMEIIGDYIFFENYSNIGALCKISNGDVEKIIEEEDFVYADGLIGNPDAYDIFYIRRTNEAYLFNREEGEILPFTLELPDDFSIQIIFSGENGILVKAKKYDTSRWETTSEKVYLYDYSGFVEMALAANK